MSDYSVSAALAAFASGVRAENLPEDVTHQAVRCMVDWLGCTIAGAATPESGRVRAAIRALDARASVTLGGDNSGFTPPRAARA